MTLSKEDRASQRETQDKATGGEDPGRGQGRRQERIQALALTLEPWCVLVLPSHPVMTSPSKLWGCQWPGPGTIRNRAAFRGRARLWRPARNRKLQMFGTFIWLEGASLFCLSHLCESLCVDISLLGLSPSVSLYFYLSLSVFLSLYFYVFLSVFSLYISLSPYLSLSLSLFFCFCLCLFLPLYGAPASSCGK